MKILITQIQQQLIKHIRKVKAILLTFSIVFLFWLFFIHYNDVHHVSISRNFFSGELKLDSTKGVKFSSPWVQVIKFDTRPMKVCIDCSCSNVNCKLISFNPKGWREFINREGFKYFWFKNRVSFNLGQENQYRGIRHILRGYAFEGEYNFLTKLDQVQ